MIDPGYLDGLNDEQRAAVLHGRGPLLLLAGAGSGKTRVLTRRIAHLVQQGVPPWNILAVTFTNKAAGEMRERVRSLVGEDGGRILVSTFHSACARFLRSDAPRLGWGSSFVIYDDDDQARLIRGILVEFKLDPKRFPPKLYLSRIDQAKNRLWGPDELLASPLVDQGARIMRLGEVFTRYEQALKAANAFDFNDLVGRMVLLLERDADLREQYRRRFTHLLVDEYQDTNHAQYRLILALSGPPHDLCVVGDDDQSIYSFRGADIRNILDFERDFPQVRTIRLERNYRSTGHILAVAGALVKHNQARKDKTLWTSAPEGERVKLLVGVDEDDEARRVVDEIGRLLTTGRRPGDIAVFYRTHAASRPLEQALGQARIPCVVVGGRRFYERREVRDVLAWLRIILNPADGMAFLRIVNVPPRGIGEVTQDGVRQHAEQEGVPVIEGARRYAIGARGAGARAVAGFVALYDRLVAEARDLPPHELILRVADATGMLAALQAEDTDEARGRIENIEALARAARTTLEGMPPDADPQELLRSFLEQASLASADQDLPDHDGQVTLMTVHLAKGLEFPVVFVVGLVEKGFPHARSSERLEDIEEERRLAYVAFTRARERLVLCRPLRRWVRGDGGGRWGGGWSECSPSPFLREIPGERTEVLGRERPARPPALAAPVPAESTRKLDALLAQVRAREARPSPAPAPPGGRSLVPEDPSLFAPGVRVRHPAFGDGVVRAVEGTGDAMKVLVQFRRVGPKRMRVREARLEVLLE